MGLFVGFVCVAFVCVLHSVFVDPLHEGGDAGVNARVRRQTAADTPADDTRLNPLGSGAVLDDERAATVTLK